MLSNLFERYAEPLTFVDSFLALVWIALIVAAYAYCSGKRASNSPLATPS